MASPLKNSGGTEIRVTVGQGAGGAQPPRLDAAKQRAAAGEVGNKQQQNQFQPYQTEGNEASPENLMKGNIGGGAPAVAPSAEGAEEPTTPPTVPNEEQPAAAAQIQRTQTAKNKINQVREDVLKSAQSLKGDLLKGRFVTVLRHLPGIGALIGSFESMIKKNIDRAIGILEFIKKRLKNLESLLAETDGLKLWGKAFAETIETIIIPLVLLLLLPAWVILVAVQPKLFSGRARKIEEFIKHNINPVLEKMKALSQKTKNEKAAALKTQELEATVETQAASAVPPPQPA